MRSESFSGFSASVGSKFLLGEWYAFSPCSAKSKIARQCQAQCTMLARWYRPCSPMGLQEHPREWNPRTHPFHERPKHPK